MPNAPVSYADFREMVKEDCIFADKTMLINDILQSNCRKFLITRPRRFGKTMALAMLDRFFNISYSEEESNDDTFAGLKISEVPQYARWSSEGGLKNSYPVIKLNLAGVSVVDTDDFERTLRSHIGSEIQSQFRQLLRSGSDDGVELQGYVSKLEDGFGNTGQILKNICNLLCSHYGVKPVVLIDEYDSPIERAYVESFFDSVLKRYYDFFNCGLKNNPDTSLVVVTGVQRVAASSVCSAMNDFTHLGISTDRFGGYFGFTEDEVLQMIKSKAPDLCQGMSPADVDEYVSERMAVAREWYDGYSFGGIGVYNTWSIVNFINNGMGEKAASSPDSMIYWNKTAQDRILTRMLSLSGDDVLSALKSFYMDGSTLALDDFPDQMVLFRPDQGLSIGDAFTFLAVTGYLAVEHVPQGYLFRIPNKEVRRNFDDLMKHVYSISIPSVILLLNHMISRDPVSVRKDLMDLMKGGSYLDGWSEQRYKSWLHDIFALHGYNAITEREAGEGRIDLLVEAYKGMPAIIFEFKVVEPDSSEDLFEIVESGVEQISARRYADSPGMAGAIALSVAFRKKTCEVVFTGC